MGNNIQLLRKGLLLSSGVAVAFFLLTTAEGEIPLVDLRSAIVVLGGTTLAVLIGYSREDLLNCYSLLSQSFAPRHLNAADRVSQIVEIANKARRNGILSIENSQYALGDRFVKKCIELSVDNLPPEQVERTLQIELNMKRSRFAQATQTVQAVSGIAPAMGLIGTLVGLVEMLANLSSPEQLGPSLAMAMLTTLYGAVIAYVLAMPLAAKLQRFGEEECLIYELTAEGFIAILQGSNPLIVEQRLHGFLPENERTAHYN